MDDPALRLQTLITSVHLTHLGEHANTTSERRVSANSNVAPNNSIRCAKALGKDLYVGCADGTLIRCILRSDGPSTGDVYSVASRQMVANKKPINDIALAPSVSKALVLAGGIIYCFTLPSLDPIPSNAIQPIREVAAFALDDEDTRKDHYAPPRPPPANSSPWGSSLTKTLDPVSLCVFRDMKIFPYTLAQRMTPTKTEGLALERPPTIVRRSGRYLCIADAEYYSIGDLETKTQIPLAPIPPGVRPLIAYVQPGEFLIASPIGETSLGVFLNGSAEPTRNAIEWNGHPLSFSLDSGSVMALLPDRTIQIHSLPKAEMNATLLQTISLSASLPPPLHPSLLSFNPGVFLIPTQYRAQLVRLVKFTLLNTRPLPSVPDGQGTSQSPSPPTPPQKDPPVANGAGADSSSSSIQSSSLVESTTLVLGSEGVQACLRPTFLARVEALLDANRIADVAKLAEPFPPGPLDMRDEWIIDRFYVFARLALKSIQETMFSDAGEYLFHSRLDPRILIRLFPDLRGGLIRENDAVNIFAGIESHLRRADTIQDIIMANLVRNYAAIKPNVQTAPSTVKLNKALSESARTMLMRYLRLVRDARRNGTQPSTEEELAKWRAVDTVYVKLLLETDQKADVLEMFASAPATIVLDEVIPLLEKYGYFGLLIQIYKSANDERALLDMWTKIAEGQVPDSDISNPMGEIIHLLSASKDRELIQEYGVWLARHEPVAAFTLFTSPANTKEPKRGTPNFDSQAILAALRQSSPVVADQYLEYLVLNRNSDVQSLHEELVTKYIDALLAHLRNPTISHQFSELSSKYSAVPARGPFLVYFASYLAPSDARTARLKASLFLQGSNLYDTMAAMNRLEAFKDVLVLERAILDGKLGNDRSALTHLARLGDASSAEAYCTLGGDVIPGKVALQVGELANLEEWARLVAAPRSVPGGGGGGRTKQGKSADEKRTRALLRILMEVYTREGRGTMSAAAADLLNSQGVNLEVADVLSSVPPTWALPTISTFLTRSFRRSQHVAHEEMIIKGLSWGQNLRISDRAFTFIRGQGGYMAETTEPPVEDRGSGTGTGTGGEPSSFSEKEDNVVVIPGPEPVVGSVTTVDLARKELDNLNGSTGTANSPENDQVFHLT